MRNWNSSLAIATGYGVDDWTSIPGRWKIFLFYTESRPALEPTQPPILWLQRVMRPALEGDHSPPSSVEVKNDSYICLPGILFR
jgi:hypothetical protein